MGERRRRALMQLNLALPSLVNAAGGMIFALAGAGILLVAGKSRRARLIGWTSVLFGAVYLAQNLLIHDDVVSSTLFSALGFASAATTAALALDVARPASRSGRWLVAVVGVVTIVATVYIGYLAHLYPLVKTGNGFRADGHGTIAQAAIAAHLPSIAMLVAACAVRSRTLPPDASREQHALAALAFAFGVFAAYFTTFIATSATGLLGRGSEDIGAASAFGAIAVAILIGALGFVDAPGVGPRVGRRLVGGLALAALAALVVNLFRSPTDTDLGSFGIVRTIGAAILVLAVVRYDLLGVSLPQLAAQRGALAAGALAALLIVAQIAQNFLSAQYGLLMGGVVAGALVFAASPIQRAIERTGEATATSDRTSAPAEASYRKAVRRALRDEILSREEMAELHELAHDLRIPGPRAHEIMVEVEQEREP